MRLKITQAGFAGYTGPLGMTHFEDGVCDHVSAHEATRLGSIMQLVEIDAKGEEIGPVGVSNEAISVHELSAPMEVKLKTQAEIDAEAAAAKEVAEAATAASGAKTPEPVLVVEDGKVFDRKELEALADEKGIKGLRVVSDKLGVKSNAIPTLIEAILAAQEAKAKAAPPAPPAPETPPAPTEA